MGDAVLADRFIPRKPVVLQHENPSHFAGTDCVRYSISRHSE